MRIPRYSLKLKKKANGYQSLHIKNNPIEFNIKDILPFKKKSYSSGYKGLTSTQVQLINQYYGGRVSHELYNKIWVYSRCVMDISEGVANLPYQVEENGKKIENEPLFDQLMFNPNSLDTGKDIIKQFISYYLLNGNGYIMNVDGGLTSDYWTLQSQGVRIIEGETFIEPILGYEYNENKKTAIIPRDNVLHMRSFNPDSRTNGLPRLTAAADEAGYSELTDKFKNSLLSNQATPSGALVSDHIMDKSEFETYKGKTKEEVTGVLNAGKMLFLDSSTKFQKFSFSPTDLNLIESEVITDSIIASMMGEPIELIGHLAKTKNISNYEASMRAFLRRTLLPLGNQLAALINKKLYPDNKKKVVINETQIPELQPSNEDLAKQEHTTLNEKRAMQGFEKMKDPNMDKIYLDGGKQELSQVNMSEDESNR